MNKILLLLLLTTSLSCLEDPMTLKQLGIDSFSQGETLSFNHEKQRALVRDVLDRSCTRCHGVGQQYASVINLSVDINVLEKNETYIKQRNAEGSFLYQKIKTGSMAKYIDDAVDREVIKTWINNIQDENIVVSCQPGEEALDNICVKSGKVLRSYGYRLVTPDEMFKDINSVFGVNLENKDPNSGLPIVPVPVTNHGFDNQFGLISTNSVFINAIAKVADNLAVALNQKSNFEPNTVSCMSDTLVDCGMSLTNVYIPKLFRRTLTAEELEVYRGFFESAEGEKKVVYIDFFKALIQSPSFLFREEHGQNPSPLHQLNAHEVASRLAFFITGQSPDAELRSKAENGTILSKTVREQQANRLMLIDSNKTHLTKVFLESIGIKKLKHEAQLSADMKEETTRVVKEIFFTGTKKWTDVFTTNYTYVNARLADIYSMSVNTNNSNFIKVNYPNNKRSGILSHASYLSAFYTNDDVNKTADIRRGLNLFENILCKDMPLPPPDVDIDQDPATDLNGCRIANRKASTSHPGGTCFQCHQHFDPIGLGFERFDNEGRYREVQADNTSCSTIEKFYLTGGQEFDTMPAYTKAISENSRVGRCLAMKMKSYAYGSNASKEYLKSIYLEMDKFKSSMNFKDLIVDIVSNDQFIKRESNDE